jgi:predicted GH43/DUF377 family glycosyl hydrolase
MQEDPRVTVHNGTAFLTYTAYTCSEPDLALATCPLGSVSEPAAWTRHGTLFPNSKSGAIIFRQPPSAPHLMIYNAGSIQLASSTDGLSWTANGTYLPPRADAFDSELTEGGPQPLPLSDGSLFYVYNSDEPGPPTRKPGWATRYHCGWAILNGSDPAQVLQRGDAPLLSPELPWETDDRE